MISSEIGKEVIKKELKFALFQQHLAIVVCTN